MFSHLYRLLYLLSHLYHLLASFNVLSGYFYVSLILVVVVTVLDCRSSLSFSYDLVRGVCASVSW